MTGRIRIAFPHLGAQALSARTEERLAQRRHRHGHTPSATVLALGLEHASP
jgi:hypothetical protein